MARKGPVAQKDLKVYSTDDYPYVIKKRGQAPSDWRFARSHREALAVMVKELQDLRGQFHRLNIAEAVTAVNYVILDVEALPLAGGQVGGVVDPYTGAKYNATLLKREPIA